MDSAVAAGGDHACPYQLVVVLCLALGLFAEHVSKAAAVGMHVCQIVLLR